MFISYNALYILNVLKIYYNNYLLLMHCTRYKKNIISIHIAKAGDTQIKIKIQSKLNLIILKNGTLLVEGTLTRS